MSMQFLSTNEIMGGVKYWSIDGHPRHILEFINKIFNVVPFSITIHWNFVLVINNLTCKNLVFGMLIFTRFGGPNDMNILFDDRFVIKA